MNLAKTTARMWAAAVDLAAVVRSDLAAGVTGVTWRRPARRCPPWCGQGHYCTARHGYPSGQHRSEPAAWSLPYGRLVATRVASVDGRHRLEVRAVVNLPADNDHAGLRAQELLTAVHLAILATLAGHAAPIPARLHPSTLDARHVTPLPGGHR